MTCGLSLEGDAGRSEMNRHRINAFSIISHEFVDYPSQLYSCPSLSFQICDFTCRIIESPLFFFFLPHSDSFLQCRSGLMLNFQGCRSEWLPCSPKKMENNSSKHLRHKTNSRLNVHLDIPKN